MFERFVREYAPYLIGIAVFIVAMAFVWFLIAMACAEPRHHRDRDEWRDLDTPSVACPDQQTLDEIEALRRMGDRETEAITSRSYGCGPVLRPRPGPFER